MEDVGVWCYDDEAHVATSRSTFQGVSRRADPGWKQRLKVSVDW